MALAQKTNHFPPFFQLLLFDDPGENLVTNMGTFSNIVVVFLFRFSGTLFYDKAMLRFLIGGYMNAELHCIRPLSRRMKWVTQAGISCVMCET